MSVSKLTRAAPPFNFTCGIHTEVGDNIFRALPTKECTGLGLPKFMRFIYERGCTFDFGSFPSLRPQTR